MGWGALGKWGLGSALQERCWLGVGICLVQTLLDTACSSSHLGTQCTAECSWKRIRMETRPKTGQGVAALLARVQGAVAHPERGPRMGVEAEGSMLGSQTRPGQEGTRAWPCSVTLGSSFPTAGMKEAAPAKGAEGCEQDGASGTGARGWVGAD